MAAELIWREEVILEEQAREVKYTLNKTRAPLAETINSWRNLPLYRRIAPAIRDRQVVERTVGWIFDIDDDHGINRDLRGHFQDFGARIHKEDKAYLNLLQLEYKRHLHYKLEDEGVMEYSVWAVGFFFTRLVFLKVQVS